MPHIEVTQYLRPDGRQKPIYFPIDPLSASEMLMYQQATELIATGARFEAEMLQTGEIYLTCIMPVPNDEPTMLASALCENGPAVVEAVKTLIETAHQVIPEKERS